ncbi:MAG TPA: HAMP domain-containing sensor histidine kinase [Mycobacteriales bacterium]|nr:HAMP domain-containing sensor histidine kinase [Mycobacteriales bacterium]
MVRSSLRVAAPAPSVSPPGTPSTKTGSAPRWPGWSLRARLTIVATVLLGVGIVAGAVLLVVTGSRTLQAAVDSGALQSAREVAALVDARSLPNPVPQGGEGTAAIQVVDAQGRVRAASTGTDQLVPVLRPAEVASVRAGRRLVVPGSRLGLSGPLRVVGVPAGPAGDRQTVVVAVDFGGARSGAKVLLVGLAIGAPLLLAVVAFAMWWVTGRALRPVEALRRGAAGLSGSGRLPVPAAQDEIRRLAETLNDMLARLDAAGARQRAFVSDAAHELRSPLASARTQLEVAAAVDAGTPAGELAGDVLLDVERLGRLVDDLLLLARLDEAPRRARSAVDLQALAGDVVSRYSAARVPVTLSPCETDCVVSAEGGAVRRVLVNLVDNAVRHARSSVRVSAGPGTLTVTDDGPGIPAADRERVFDRFTRLDSDRGRDSGGAGLGLAIVRELVTAHGGNVSLSDAGPGLVVTVHFPASR